MRSGQGKGDDLLSINIDRNQPKTGQPLRNFPPGKQEPSSGSYQNPRYKNIFKLQGSVTISSTCKLTCNVLEKSESKQSKLVFHHLLLGAFVTSSRAL